ncbi:hypothetical protein IYY11_00500 [Methylocystis sp. H62]|uniref:hypothetical protein n=1 Tax=Methylocystis sp. H62 TaxID=2785789 RepID=UPI0018C2C643|nr:hypothetical protein [Methylocystis sp. H62]MBG0791988.1 hypothetical protein [Methylocystis sp. H62]
MLHSVSPFFAISSGLARAINGCLVSRRLSPAGQSDHSDNPYAVTPMGAIARRALGLAPPHLRETAAERWLRRVNAPGPAAEHVFQFLLDDSELTVTKGANNFYTRQYRQYLNATMGVFAMTAETALLGCAAEPDGFLFRRTRPVCAAMVEDVNSAPPILVLDHQSVAVPLLLPTPRGDDPTRAIDFWLAGRNDMPNSYKQLVAGDEIRCATPRARARRRSAVAALIELADAVRKTKRLAILALHPRDPDAMGLHITLFGVELINPDQLAHDYALDQDFIARWRDVAESTGRLLRFFVGGTEEVFTQCSQNLFVKRRAPRPSNALRAGWPDAWNPGQPLEALIAKQFELFQVTASASGLPGVSPRNGRISKAAFVCHSHGGARLLIPYFTGNAVHGHAAKLWSNPSGAIVIWDDHTSLSATTISGRSHIASHEWVEKNHPEAAEKLTERKKRSGASAIAPVYWFVQEVAQIFQQDEPLARKALDPMRPTCSIHAAGHASHGKKPAYFAADTLPPYDQKWQHERELKGRPIDASGFERRHWERAVEPRLAARRRHLSTIDPNAPLNRDDDHSCVNLS